MARLINPLFSKHGMTIINVLFFLSAFIRNRGIIFAAYLVWIIYLISGIKRTSSRAVQITNSLFLVFAIAMIGINLLVMLRLM